MPVDPPAITRVIVRCTTLVTTSYFMNIPIVLLNSANYIHLSAILVSLFEWSILQSEVQSSSLREL